MAVSPKKRVSLKAVNFFISLFGSIFLVSGFWVLFIALQSLGFPCPLIEKSKFLDLSFFTFSNFSFITFLTMIPIQNVEGKLSPGFYSRVIRTPWTNFGLYALLVCTLICLFVSGICLPLIEKYLSSLFMAIISTLFFSVIYHRIMTLRALYEPYIVYKNIDKLLEETSEEEVWLDLVEITYKAIIAGRLSEAKIFIYYLDNISKKQDTHLFYQEDLKSLHKAAKGLSLITRHMESLWPFLSKASDEKI